MDVDDIAIERIGVEDLRADTSGVLIEQMGSLAHRAFREPPWNDDLEKPRLHFGLGVDLMRRNAVALIAKAKDSGTDRGLRRSDMRCFERAKTLGTSRSGLSPAPPRSIIYSRRASAYSTQIRSAWTPSPEATDRLWTRGRADPCASQAGIHLPHRAHRHRRDSDAGPFCQARIRRATGARCRISRADLLVAQALTCWRNLVPALAVASAAPLDPVVGTFVSSSDSAINLAHCRLTASQ